jgi:hypothetical protein
MPDKAGPMVSKHQLRCIINNDPKRPRVIEVAALFPGTGPSNNEGNFGARFEQQTCEQRTDLGNR